MTARSDTTPRGLKIVLAADGSPQALAAARWLAGLPLAAQDEILVASVAVRPVLLGAWSYVGSSATTELMESSWHQAQTESQAAADAAAAELSGLPAAVRTLVREGHPIATLPRIVEELAADLLVVGPHGRGRFESILLGSVSQSLLHAMPTSILVAREPLGPPERVLLAFDGSPHSLAAARFLAGFPLPSQTRIDVLMVEGARTEPPADESQAAEWARPAIDVLQSAGKDARPLVRSGDAKRQILAAAGELKSGLVVLGARGTGGFAGLLLGSVSRAVSKAAPCSTLVVANRAAAHE